MLINFFLRLLKILATESRLKLCPANIFLLRKLVRTNAYIEAILVCYLIW